MVAALYLSALMMELCWLGAWLTFVWSSVYGQAYPLLELLAGAGLVLVLARCTAVRVLTHAEVCRRFDLGMYWLFALLGARLLLRAVPQVPVQSPLTDALVPCYFVSGLSAVAVARFRSQSSRQWLRVAGQLSAVFLGVAACTALLFCVAWLSRSYLRSVAENSHAGAASSLRPVAGAFAEVVLYLLSKGREHPLPVHMPGRMPVPSHSRRLPEEVIAVTLEHATTHGGVLWVVTVLAVLGAVALGWWRTRGRVPRPFAQLFAFLQRLSLHKPRARLASEPLQLMASMLVWGRRSGMPRQSAETPLEYATRLKQRFAGVRSEIDLIVDSHCRYTYAQCAEDDCTLQPARRALARMRSPRHWPTRAATWWLGRS